MPSIKWLDHQACHNGVLETAPAAYKPEQLIQAAWHRLCDEHSQRMDSCTDLRAEHRQGPAYLQATGDIQQHASHKQLPRVLVQVLLNQPIGAGRGVP